MSLVVDCVLIDCVDLDVMTAFWCEALDLEHVWTGPSGGHLLTATDGSGRRLALMPSHSTKTAKNRVHFDLRPDREQHAEVRRLEGLGARRIDIGQVDVPWVVMADPEGNEFCVLRSLADKEKEKGLALNGWSLRSRSPTDELRQAGRHHPCNSQVPYRCRLSVAGTGRRRRARPRKSAANELA